MDGFLKAMGMRILLRRKELGLTQEEVAERAGITSQTISTAERGEKALRPENIVRISMALDVSTDFLLLGTAACISQDMLPQRIAKLSSRQRSYLERIIDSFIDALAASDSEE